MMTIVFKISDNIKPLMLEFYKDRILPTKPPYSVFQVKEFDCVITLYESGKVMFQGIGADIEASYWIEEERIKNGRIINPDGSEKKNTPEKRILFIFSGTLYSNPFSVEIIHNAETAHTNVVTSLSIRKSISLVGKENNCFGIICTVAPVFSPE